MYRRTFKNRLKRLTVCISVLILSIMLASCTYFVDRGDKSLPKLYPNDGIIRSMNATMYAGLIDYACLIGIEARVTLSANEPPLEALLRTLIAGKFPCTCAVSAIPVNIEVVSVSQSGNIIYITLNKEFLQSAAFLGGGYVKALATYSIVNTTLAYSPQCSVQILIDKKGNGVGERVTYGDLGINTLPAQALAEPFPFTPECVAGIKDIAVYTLDALKIGNFTRAIRLMQKKSGDLDAVAVAQYFGALYKVTDFSVNDTYTAYSGESAYAVCDISVANISGEITQLTGIKLPLFMSNGVLKISYDDLVSFIEGGV